MASNEIYSLISIFANSHFINERFAAEGNKDEGRFAWSSMGDLIESSGFFPLTINVPDMITGMYEMFHQTMDYFFGSVNESAPRIFEMLKAIENDLPDLE